MKDVYYGMNFLKQESSKVLCLVAKMPKYYDNKKQEIDACLLHQEKVNM